MNLDWGSNRQSESEEARNARIQQLIEDSKSLPCVRRAEKEGSDD